MNKKTIIISIIIVSFGVIRYLLNPTGCDTGDCENGKGSYVYWNEDYYVGEFKDKKRHGQGKFFGDDFIYEGEWKDGKKNGYGVEEKDNGEKYSGEWKNGKRDGQGTYSFSEVSGKHNGRNLIMSGKYIGGFKDDLQHGLGVFYYDKVKSKGEENLTNIRTIVESVIGKINVNIIYYSDTTKVFIRKDGNLQEVHFDTVKIYLNNKYPNSELLKDL